MQKRTLFIFGLIFLAAISRIIPHPENFAPIGVMALFGAAYFKNKKYAFILPLIALWISDLIINNIFFSDYYGRFVLFTEGAIWIFLSFVSIALLGILIFRKVTLSRLIIGSLAASYIFFLITNFGVWMSGALYPLTAEGLSACYSAAIPFFKNTLFGNAVYAAVLFGGYELAKSRMDFLSLKLADL
jgi:hypothetical protein